MSGESAAELCHKAQSALSTSPIFELRDLTVDRSGAVLVIAGRVSSYYHKQLAQEVVLAVSQPLVVDNEVNVDKGPNPTNSPDQVTSSSQPTSAARHVVWTS